MASNDKSCREALQTISRMIWERIDPYCNDDCCKPWREIARIADKAIANSRNCDRHNFKSADEFMDFFADEEMIDLYHTTLTKIDEKKELNYGECVESDFIQALNWLFFTPQEIQGNEEGCSK